MLRDPGLAWANLWDKDDAEPFSNVAMVVKHSLSVTTGTERYSQDREVPSMAGSAMKSSCGEKQQVTESSTVSWLRERDGKKDTKQLTHGQHAPLATS